MFRVLSYKHVAEFKLLVMAKKGVVFLYKTVTQDTFYLKCFRLLMNTLPVFLLKLQLFLSLFFIVH